MFKIRGLRDIADDYFRNLFTSIYGDYERWKVCGEDISNACTQLLHLGEFFCSINDTNIVLVPKSDTPSSIIDFRHIPYVM